MKSYSLLLFLLASSIVQADVARVNKIVDGDTIHINNSDVICRFAYIDTPESIKNSKAIHDSSRCNGITTEYLVDAGLESKKFLKGLIAPGDIIDVKINGTDKYGRSICEVSKDGEDINLKLIDAGYAITFNKYIFDPNIKRKFNTTQTSAKMHQRGLWKTHKSAIACMENNSI